VQKKGTGTFLHLLSRNWKRYL